MRKAAFIIVIICSTARLKNVPTRKPPEASCCFLPPPDRCKVSCACVKCVHCHDLPVILLSHSSKQSGALPIMRVDFELHIMISVAEGSAQACNCLWNSNALL